MLLTREDTWKPWWVWLFCDDAADGLRNQCWDIMCGTLTGYKDGWFRSDLVLEPRNRFSVHSITGGCLIFGCVGGALEMSSDWSGSAAYALRPAYL